MLQRKKPMWAALLIVCSLCLNLYLANYSILYRHMQNGALNGFSIVGSYQSVGTQHVSLSMIERECEGPSTETLREWQLVEYDGTTLEGHFRPLGDPNIFVLTTVDGKRLGIAHLSYSTPNGTDGALYLVEEDGTTTQFAKTSDIPGFLALE